MLRFIIMTSLLWSFILVNAQVIPLDLKDHKWVFGIQTGVNYQNLHSKEVPKFGYSKEGGIGMNFSMVGEYKFNQTISLLPKIGLSFNGAKLSSSMKELEYIMPINLDFSAYASFALTKNRNNLYVFLGPTYSVPFNTKSTFSTKNYLSMDIGLGLNQYFKKMIFSLELRYSGALGNVSEAVVVDHLIPHTFSLLFGFKG